MKKTSLLKYALLLSLAYGATLTAHQSSSVQNLRPFNPQELSTITASNLEKNTPINSQQDIQSFINKHEIINQTLSKYNVTGCASAIDPNFTFIAGTISPDFWIIFSDQNNNAKLKNYKAQINTFGFKFVLAVNIDCIFLVNTDPDFYNIKKAIRLGVGIDLRMGLANITYVPFSNVPGGILIFGLPLGFSGGISIVTGGHLTPIN
ncbi:MAG: hypothetical protein ABH827_02795 [bacterium]